MTIKDVLQALDEQIPVNDYGETKRSNCSSFIYVQNVPWSATRSDVRQLFIGLSIKKGGILIRNDAAFVSLENALDTVVAILQTKPLLLLGSPVQLSVISKAEMQKLLIRNVRRKLDFGQTTAITKSQNLQTKKIRPTPVFGGRKRRALSSLAFVPQELNIQPSPYIVGENGLRCLNKSSCGTKRVHPTRISDTMDIENFSVFHPDISYEIKKNKLDVQAVCVFQA